MTIQHKDFELTKAADGWIVASTPVVDRQKDRIFTRGINTENYLKNPVLIYGHGYSEPWSIVGRVAEIIVDDDGMRILPELREPVNDADPMNIVKALWEQGLLKGASIGINPIMAQSNRFGGLDVKTCELLEISLVPLPVNQEALRIAVKAFEALPGKVEATAEPEPEPEPEPPPATWAIDTPPVPFVVTVVTPPAAPAADPEPEQNPATVDDTAASEAATELRLAAILSEFVASIRPLLEGVKS